MNGSIVGLIVLSLFCLGGLFAYGREALRLNRLLASGRATNARVTAKKKVETGSESVVNYLVTYTFTDSRGHSILHEEDLNDSTFFDGVNEGDVIPILFVEAPRPTSYPLSQVRRDRTISLGVAAAIAILWIVMSAFFLST